MVSAMRTFVIADVQQSRRVWLESNKEKMHSADRNLVQDKVAHIDVIETSATNVVMSNKRKKLV